MHRLTLLLAFTLLLALSACRSGSRRRESSPAAPTPDARAASPEEPSPLIDEPSGESPTMNEPADDVAIAGEAPSAAVAAPPVEEPGTEADFVFVFLRAGTGGAGKTTEELQQLGAGHLANITRLASERKLVVAGPFGPGGPEPALRGIFILNVPSIERAQELVQSDPAVAAGSFVVEAHRWRANKALRDVLELDLAAEAVRKQTTASDVTPFELRNYVLVDAYATPDIEDALAGLREEGRLLFFGRMQGEGSGRVIFLLDVREVADARVMLEPAAGSLTQMKLHPWVGSASLTQLPELEGRR